MSAKRPTRFLRWFRALPLAVLLAAFAVSATFASAPTTLAAELLYPVHYADLLEASATRHGVDPALAAAVARCESGWNPDAASSAGAVGLMQVMPSTAEELAQMGVVDAAAYPADDLYDPAVNIEYGCAYLGVLEGELGDADEVICAYNAGLGAVQGWLAEGGSIADKVKYQETRDYLERVRISYEGFKTCYPDGLA